MQRAVRYIVRMDPGTLTLRARPTGLRRRLLWIWGAFWVLMALLGAQEYLWSGGRQLWSPLIEYGIAALLSTVIAVVQIRRSMRDQVELEKSTLYPYL